MTLGRIVPSLDDMSQKESGQSEPASSAGYLVVGLGASAGGLEALEEFFDELPANSGMAFVVVTHQSADKVSLLTELIGRHCKMPVQRVDTTMPIEPNRVYVQPPGATLGVLKGALFPFEPRSDGPKPLAIDFFFRSLAQDQKDQAVGIVLSGTGSDGTNGLKEIRAVSGLVMAQDEQTARYAGMPHSASVALQLDFVLAPREMARQLLAYRDGPTRTVLSPELDAEPGEVMNRLFVLLRSRSGHDFSNYKMTTIGRRVARRMSVHDVTSAKDYLKFVQSSPHELDQLFKELLIGVTSFFRDPEGFDALGAALPPLLASKPEDYLFRAWIAGCSTGEEAYSLAMLLREQMETTSPRRSVQIFATDLDSDAVEFARAGVFPESIQNDVSPKRLERFFVRENGYFRVKKEIREMVVFAVQDLIEDPPFTKLDFLLCRNLLIYLNAEIQQRLIPLFHYALRPAGILMLGSSETVEAFPTSSRPSTRSGRFFPARRYRRERTSQTWRSDTPSTPPPGRFADRSAPAAPNPAPRRLRNERSSVTWCRRA